MLILLEGLDRTGKTTLAEKLAREHGGAIRHCGAPEHDGLTEYAAPLRGFIPPRDTVIYDRHYVGELVWPTIFGRPAVLDRAQRAWLEMFLESRGAVIIRTHRDHDEIVEACAADGEPIQGATIAAAGDLFTAVLRDALLPVFNVDIAGDQLSLRTAQMSAANRASDSILRGRYWHPRWVGRRWPRALLVGDQVNPPLTPDGSAPARRRAGYWPLPFVPKPNTSGHFLMAELLQTGPFGRPLFHEVALVNARTPSGRPEDVAMIHAGMGRPPLVAMGNRASAQLHHLGLEHRTVPHPQYIRRFKRAAGPGYMARLVEEAMA